MRSTLLWARALTIATLALVGASSLALVFPSEATFPLAAMLIGLLLPARFMLGRDRWVGFSLAAGSMLAVAIGALALVPDVWFVWPWAMLGAGIAAILAGNHTCRASSVLVVRMSLQAGMEEDFRRAALKGYARILSFVGLVWLASLFVLLLSLNAAVGAMPSWAMAGLGLLAMVALAWLALVRHAEA
jgi:hypothetical protein